MEFLRSIVALVLLLTFGSIVFVSAFNFSNALTEHGAMQGMDDCPFMTHSETLCPMTALDHLMTLRSIFETVAPSISTLLFAVGVALTSCFFASKQRPLLQRRVRTFLRWRAFITYSFFYRLYQELFARGILHPKLFL